MSLQIDLQGVQCLWGVQEGHRVGNQTLQGLQGAFNLLSNSIRISHTTVQRTTDCKWHRNLEISRKIAKLYCSTGLLKL